MGIVHVAAAVSAARQSERGHSQSLNDLMALGRKSKDM